MAARRSPVPQIEQPIIAYLQGVVAESGGGPVTADTGLLDSGLLDSINLVRLVQFLEEQFQIRIPDDDLGADLFASPATLSAYVAKRLS
jgi:acyl carrier protein